MLDFKPNWRKKEYIGKGSYSTSWLIPDFKSGEKYLVMTPNTDIKKWIDGMNRNRLMSNHVRKFNRSKFFLPKIYQINKNPEGMIPYCVMEYFNGLSLVGPIIGIEKQTTEIKQKLGEALGIFLNTLHQSSSSKRMKKVPFIRQTRLELVDKYDLRNTHTALSPLLHGNGADIEVPIHHDLGRHNLLFDKNKEEIALIDWGISGIAPAIEEFFHMFIAFPSHCFTEDVLDALINTYNSLDKPYKDIHINFEALKVAAVFDNLVESIYDLTKQKNISNAQQVNIRDKMEDTCSGLKDLGLGRQAPVVKRRVVKATKDYFKLSAV